MLYRMQKFAIGMTHLALLYLLVLTFYGADWSLAVGCVALSATWLALTTVQIKHLLRCFADRMARRNIWYPLGTGVLLSVIALAASAYSRAPTTAAVAVAELLGWALIWAAYVRTRRGYYKLKAGYMWNDAWVNPPDEEVGPGCIILTDGRMAARSGNTVGHSELVVQDEQGVLWAVSSWQGKGALKNKMRVLLRGQRMSKEHYIVLKPVVPWTKEQAVRAYNIAVAMIERNKAWAAAVTARRLKRIAQIPLIPESWREWLKAKLTPHDGYDWLGTYIGTIKRDRWTCMGFIITILRSLGMDIENFGTGALGLTGLANPLMPIRFATQCRFYCLLTKPAEERTKQAADATAAGTNAS